MMTLTVIAAQNGLAIVLPPEIVERMCLQIGDRIYVEETADGIALTSFNPAYAPQIAPAENAMRAERDLLESILDYTDPPP